MIALLLAFSSFVSLVQSEYDVHSQDDVHLSTHVSPAQKASDETTCQVGQSVRRNNDVSVSTHVMTCDGERTIKKGTLLATLPKLGNVWRLSLDFKPLEHTHSTPISLGCAEAICSSSYHHKLSLRQLRQIPLGSLMK